MNEDKTEVEVEPVVEPEAVPEVEAEQLSADDQFDADFPELNAEPQPDQTKNNTEAQEQVEETQLDSQGEQELEPVEAETPSFDQLLEQVNQKNQQKYGAQEPTITKMEVERLPEDGDDEITNEINKAVNRQQATLVRQFNERLSVVEGRQVKADKMVQEQKNQRIETDKQKFTNWLGEQGYPSNTHDMIENYVSHLPKDKVQGVFNIAEGFNSARMFLTMMEADLGVDMRSKHKVVDESSARAQGERAATERLRANPSSNTAGRVQTPVKKTWAQHSDKEWAEVRNNITDEEAFGL